METITPRFDWSMTFLAVVEHGGFSAAAEHTGQSKAYISKQVSQLERDLGVALLYRTTRRIALTETGRLYLTYCLQLRDTLAQASRAIDSLRSEVSGHIKLSAPVSLGVSFVGDLLLAFRRRYPLISVELDLSQQQRDLIADGFDLALRAGNIIDEQLVALPVGVIQDWVVASPDLLARTGSPQAPAELVSLPCLINSHYANGNQWLFEREAQKQSITLPADLSINHYAALHHLCLKGAGFAKLPSYLVVDDVRQGHLIRVLSGYNSPQTALYLVTAPIRPQPAKVRALIDFIRDWFTHHQVS